MPVLDLSQLPEDVYRAARIRAAELNLSLKQYVIESLRRDLATPSVSEQKK